MMYPSHSLLKLCVLNLWVTPHFEAGGEWKVDDNGEDGGGVSLPAVEKISQSYASSSSLSTLWTPWSPWTPCSVNCGIGVTRRLRTCRRPSDESHDKNIVPCAGLSTVERACVMRPCDDRDIASPVDVMEGRSAILRCKHRLEGEAEEGVERVDGDGVEEAESDVELLWITPTGHQIRRGTRANKHHMGKKEDNKNMEDVRKDRERENGEENEEAEDDSFDRGKFHLQGDQLVIDHAEISDGGHFSCILIKKSTGKFLETSSVELLVKNCSAKPCKNGGECVETFKNSVFSLVCECTSDFDGDYCEVGRPFWSRFLFVIFLVGSAHAVGGCACAFLMKTKRFQTKFDGGRANRGLRSRQLNDERRESRTDNSFINNIPQFFRKIFGNLNNHRNNNNNNNDEDDDDNDDDNNNNNNNSEQVNQIPSPELGSNGRKRETKRYLDGGEATVKSSNEAADALTEDASLEVMEEEMEDEEWEDKESLQYITLQMLV